MKIKQLQLYKVPPRWLFLKITTDDNEAGRTLIEDAQKP